MYLRLAIKDGSVKSAIDGLSHIGYQYLETVDYDVSKQVLLSHVQAILDVPSLKERNGREIRRLHDVLRQMPPCYQSYGLYSGFPFDSSHD